MLFISTALNGLGCFSPQFTFLIIQTSISSSEEESELFSDCSSIFFAFEEYSDDAALEFKIPFDFFLGVPIHLNFSQESLNSSTLELLVLPRIFSCEPQYSKNSFSERLSLLVMLRFVGKVPEARKDLIFSNCFTLSPTRPELVPGTILLGMEKSVP